MQEYLNLTPTKNHPTKPNQPTASECTSTRQHFKESRSSTDLNTEGNRSSSPAPECGNHRRSWRTDSCPLYSRHRCCDCGCGCDRAAAACPPACSPWSTTTPWLSSLKIKSQQILFKNKTPRRSSIRRDRATRKKRSFLWRRGEKGRRDSIGK